MTVLQPLLLEIVSQSTQLYAASLGLANEQAIALDTESNSRHRYPEQLCLIQIATRHNVHLIDTIILKDIAPLKSILADNNIVKVIHGADYDIRCLDRHYGFRIRNLYDTGIAARFAGMTEFGLTALIKNLLGITIVKSERLQQSDWGRRPLSPEALEYAAADVHHLLALREKLEERLQSLRRTTWVAEECARLTEVRYAPPNLETAYLSVKGAQSLDGKSLAIFRRLFLFREEESLRQHRPPFFVIPDFALLSLATNPSGKLSEVRGLGHVGLQRFGKGLQQALTEGMSAPAIQLPHVTIERPSGKELIRLTRLKKWRTSLSQSLSLDPSLLWPMASIERLAKNPDCFDKEIASPVIRNWQLDQFASSLRVFLKSLL